MLFARGHSGRFPTVIGSSGVGQPLIAGMGQSNEGRQGSVSLLTGGDVALGDAYTGGRYTFYELGSESDTNPAIRDWQDFAPVSGRIGFEASMIRQLGPGHHMAKWLVGGSSLDWWRDNGKFTEAANWILSQKARLPFQTRIAYLEWCQGESGPTTGWRALAEEGFDIVRDVFGDPDLNVIIIQTHPTLGDGTVAQDQVDLAAADSRVHIVLTGGYPLNPTPHWNVPEVARIGEDIATIGAGLL